jgi:hypothetical protein
MTRIEAYKNELEKVLRARPSLAQKIVYHLEEQKGADFPSFPPEELIVVASAILEEVEEKFTEPLTR